jgi:hypothetical protein
LKLYILFFGELEQKNFAQHLFPSIRYNIFFRSYTGYAQQ